MLALGSCLAGVGLFATGLLALLFRHPNAPGWTRPEIVALLACIPVTVTTGLGLGYVAFGLTELLKGAGDPRELLVPAGVLLVLAAAWRGLRIKQRLKDYAAVAGELSPGARPAPQPPLLVDEMPPPAPQPRSGRPKGEAA